MQSSHYSRHSEDSGACSNSVMVILSLDCQLLPWVVKPFLPLELLRVMVTVFNSTCNSWLGLQNYSISLQIAVCMYPALSVLTSTGYWYGYRIEGEKVIECNFRRSHQVITLDTKYIIKINVSSDIMIHNCFSRHWPYLQKQLATMKIYLSTNSAATYQLYIYMTHQQGIL